MANLKEAKSNNERIPKAMIKKFYLKISMLSFIAAFAAMPAAAEHN